MILIAKKQKKAPRRRVNFETSEETEITYTHQQTLQAIEEGKFGDCESVQEEVELPVQLSPITPRVGVVQHTGLTDQIERMKEVTPAPSKRGLEEGKESEGKTERSGRKC